MAGADLRGAMLIGTDLQAAILESAMLEAADYDPKTTQFPVGFDPQQAGLKSDR
nr:pentapeptide repeat-containing protein [Chamaesiphon sp. OTE_75_metabat_556]